MWIKRIVTLLTCCLFVLQLISAQAVVETKVRDASGKLLDEVLVQFYPYAISGLTDESGSYVASIPIGEAIVRLYFGGENRDFNVRINGDTIFDLGLVKTLELDQITVKSLKGGGIAKTSNQNVSKEEISKLDFGQDAPYLLEWTPSMVVTSDAGAGVGYTSMRIRGIDQTRINVTINGVPLNDAESQNVFWVDLPDILASSSEISIQRGVGSSTNGAAAFGSSVDLQTNVVQKEAYGRIEGAYGTYNTQKFSAQFGTGLINDAIIIDGRLSKIQSDGYVDRASSDLTSYYLSANYIKDKSNLKYTTFSGHEITYQAWYGIPGEWLPDREKRRQNLAGTEKEGEAYQDQVDNYRQTHHQLVYNRSLGRIWDLSLTGFYTGGNGYYEEYKSDQGLSDYGMTEPIFGMDTIKNSNLVRRRWLDNDFYGIIGNVTGQFTSGLDLYLGGAFSLYEGQHYGEVIWAQYFVEQDKDFRYYDNNARKTDGNLYGKLAFNGIESWKFFADLQGRLINYDFQGLDQNGNQVPSSVSLFFLNPKIGALWQPKPSTSISFSAGIAHKEPNRDDYVNSDPEDRPKPEALFNIEAGIQHRLSKKFDFLVNGYLMYYKDQLVLTGEINDVGAYTRVNVDQSNRTGIELQAKYKPSKLFSLTADMTLSSSRIKQFTEYVDTYDAEFEYIGQTAFDLENTNLAFSPNFISALMVNYLPVSSSRHELNVWANFKYVSSQFIANSSDPENKLEAYTFLNLGLNYTFKGIKSFIPRLSLSVMNVTDKLYATNAWSYRYVYNGEVALDQGYYPQATIHLMVKLSLDF